MDKHLEDYTNTILSHSGFTNMKKFKLLRINRNDIKDKTYKINMKILSPQD